MVLVAANTVLYVIYSNDKVTLNERECKSLTTKRKTVRVVAGKVAAEMSVNAFVHSIAYGAVSYSMLTFWTRKHILALVNCGDRYDDRLGNYPTGSRKFRFTA